MKKILYHFIDGITPRKVLGVILGNIILAAGIALLRFFLMGNDPFCAMNMALGEGLNISFGTVQLIMNIVLLIFQLIFGRSYFGFGSLINLLLLGYIADFWGWVYGLTLGESKAYTFLQRLTFMIVALIIVSFGLSMYQAANLGIAPYDYLSFGMTDHMPTPYFFNRILTDGSCVIVILICVQTGFLNWSTSHLGIATVITALCLGPLVNFFAKIHRKWMLL